MHLSEGEIHSYLDNELDDPRRKIAEEHLESCSTCSELLVETQNTISMVSTSLGTLEPESLQKETSSQAYQLVEKKIRDKEATMSKNSFQKVPRLTWVALGVILLLAVSMAFSPIRAIANSFLGLFRVEQVRVVEMEAANIPDQLESSAQFEYMLSNQVTVEDGGELIEVSNREEASQKSGLEVRLPANLEMEPKLSMQPGGELTFNMDLEQIQTIMGDLGYGDIELPESIDGQSVTVNIQNGVLAEYGDCQIEELKEEMETGEADSKMEDIELTCTSLVQVPSPEINAPADLDLAQLGTVFLQITGMDKEEAESFAKTVDWTTTLIVPVPRYSTEYEQVQVDGVQGSLIKRPYAAQDEYVLIWVKDGIVYALAGPGNAQVALEIANSIE